MKNSKLLIVLLSVLLVSLSGCGKGNKARTTESEMQTKCIGGVEYYLFSEFYVYDGYGFMAPKYKKDGTISLCN